MIYQQERERKAIPQYNKTAFTFFYDHDLWKSTIAFFDFLCRTTEKTIKFMEMMRYIAGDIMEAQNVSVWENIRGRLFVIDDRCKGCGFCIEFCPKGVLKQSEKINKKGYHPPVLHDPEGCMMCDICTDICPDFAIYRERTKKR
jgi:Ferredoxin